MASEPARSLGPAQRRLQSAARARLNFQTDVLPLDELSHLHPAKDVAATQVEATSVDHDICLDCLAFAQIAGLAHFDVPTMPDVDAPRYAYVAEAARDVADAESPAHRSRGPPLSA